MRMNDIASRWFVWVLVPVTVVVCLAKWTDITLVLMGLSLMIFGVVYLYETSKAREAPLPPLECPWCQGPTTRIGDNVYCGPCVFSWPAWYAHEKTVARDIARDASEAEHGE